MALETVTLVADGFRFAAWETVLLGAAINEACRKFDFSTSERPGQFAFPPGTPIEVLATGDLFLRGYVNAYEAGGTAKTHRISIKGRSRSQDFVDCSGVHETGYSENKTPVEFAQEMAGQVGVDIEDEVGLDTVPYQQLMQGEPGFDCLERGLRPQGATAMGAADGSIKVTNASKAKRASGLLQEGVNIMEWGVNISDGSRYSDYAIKGQNRHGYGKTSLRIKETAKDPGVGRYRPKIIVNEGDTDSKRAATRAHHEKERCAGACIRAQVMVPGWRDVDGALWTPNTIIFTSSPKLMHLEQDMLIERIELFQSSGSRGQSAGTTSRLHLVDPRTYRGQGHDGKQSDGSWNAGLEQ